MNDTDKRRLEVMCSDAGLRNFGAIGPRMELWIRHGYLLAIEEVTRALEGRCDKCGHEGQFGPAVVACDDGDEFVYVTCTKCGGNYLTPQTASSPRDAA